MPTNTLSDNDCRKAEPRAKAFKLFDGNGLYLWVSPKGAKVWRQAYRFAGKPDTLVHGAYPLITLKAARELRDEALRKLAAGMDPKAAQAQAAPAAGLKTITLLQASETFWDGKGDISDDYRANAKRGIELHLGPALGKRDIRTITREDLLEALNAMDAAGKHVYVRKVRMWASQVWHWAVEQKFADSNVPDTINPRRAFGKKKVRHFASLHERDFGAFWRRVHLEDDLLSVMAAKLLAYTMSRTKEVRFMEWTEIDAFAPLLAAGGRGPLPDPAQAWTWEVPEGKMKRSRAHVVPLPRQAREVLLKLWARRRTSKYVLPAEHREDRTISENTVLALIERIGYKGVMTGHGFRSVASTWGNERGYNSDWIERQLSHVEENKVRGAYNKAEYLAGRRKLLQELSDWIDGHLNEEAANSDSALMAA
jgi:integrase